MHSAAPAAASTVEVSVREPLPTDDPLCRWAGWSTTTTRRLYRSLGFAYRPLRAAALG